MKNKNLFCENVLLQLGGIALSCVIVFTATACNNGGDIPPVPGDESYSVTYDGNENTDGDVPVDPNIYDKGDTVTVLGNTDGLIKTGATFSGWNTEADGSGTTYTQGQTFTMGAADAVLYAQWTNEPTCTVTYDGNGNSGGEAPVDNTNYTEGQTVTVMAQGTLIKTWYAFNGWNTASNGTGASYTAGQTFVIGTVDVTLFAQWTDLPTYTVTYYNNGSTGGTEPVDDTYYHEGQTVIVLANTGNLSKTGYTFAGWNTAANGTGAAFSPGQSFAMGAANVSLYAQWSPDPTYTVTYSGNESTGGTAPEDPVDYLAGQTVTVLGPGTLVRTGYSFNGWNTAANGSGTAYAAGQTFTIGTADVTLFAQWTALPTYTVAYNGNENTGGTAPVDSTGYLAGQTVTVLGPGTLVRTGYSFSGWNTAANGSETSFAAGETFAIGTADVTLYAQWTALPTYSVSYNGNENTGGTAPVDSTNYLSGQTVTVLDQGTLVNTGYTFNGWNTAADGSGTTYAAGATFTMGSANVILYAVWQSEDTQFTEIRRGFDDSGVQISQRETVYASRSAYEATYDPGQKFGYLQDIIANSEGASGIQPPYIVSTKISNGAGSNGIWMDGDDVDVYYVVNKFDDYGNIYETGVYRDFYGVRRLEYTRYTLNSDGTYYKILFYGNSGMFNGSVYFTNQNGFMKQLDYWSEDGTGTQNQQIVLAYDSSWRLTSVVQLMNNCSGDECTGLENLQRKVYEYSGSNIQPSKMKLSMWVVGLAGGYWYSMGSISYTLNTAGTYILKSSGSLMSVGTSSEYTYNSSNFYDIITNYSDTGWDTLSGYYEFTYQ
ncbi:MAG: InlB B-repeat-containing protein [Spirochaetes bacterium]|nr:InlB B-repeat-containing protein [Spirochaetota bacterium]